MKVAGTHLQAAPPDPAIQEDWTVRRNRCSEILLTKVINWITFSKEQMGTYNQKSLKILPDPAILPLETYPEKITSNILQPGLCDQTGPGTDPPSVCSHL